MTQSPPHRDIIVIGASAGGLEVLSKIVAALPADLPATVFVVIHMQAGFPSSLPEILMRSGPLPASFAVHGEAFVAGRIYIAPPDNHLMLQGGFLHVARGPKENGHRPSIDALFRTASIAFGPRVIGVVLTGYLDCGTVGLLSVKARGGVSVIQDPTEASAPDMPRSAERHVEIDHIARAAEIGPLLVDLTRGPPALWPSHLPSGTRRFEGDDREKGAALLCPLCQGDLTDAELDGSRVFGHHVGQAFSLRSVAAEHAEEVERALWAGLRALEGAATVSRRLASQSGGDLAGRFLEKEETQGRQARVLRTLLLGEPWVVSDDEAAEKIKTPA